MPDKRAKKAMEDARAMMNTRTSTEAIQECLLRQIIEPASEEAIFAPTAASWMTSKAGAYGKMMFQLMSLPASSFTKASDKDLLNKFLTEQMGIEGAKYAIRQKSGCNIADADFQIFHGPNVINVVVLDTAPSNTSGLGYAAEAKGGVSQLKGDQGTMANLDREAKKMAKSPFNSRKLLRGESKGQRDARVKKERQRRRETGLGVRKLIAMKKISLYSTTVKYNKANKQWISKVIKEAK